MTLLSERRKQYRRVLEGNVCVHPASVFDAMSARMAESLGFEVLMFAGSIASGTVLGSPEEMLGKLRAAVAARQDPSLVVIGRTQALRDGGIAEAEKRVRAYQET